MKKTFPCLAAFLLLWLAAPSPARAQYSDVILQGFYWNSHPGDVSDNQNGGIWWDSLATVAPQLAGAGFGTVWTPPMTKSFGGLWDMGYGIKDYYDFGSYNQNGSIRTRHGNLAQFQAMMSALHGNGLHVMADIVLNHRGGADGQAPYEVPWGGPTPYTIFNPASGRFPGVPAHFHPNSFHSDQNPDYRNNLFFEDLCYFNNNDQVGPPGGWYFGAPPFGLGAAGDSLIAWGRWLVNDVGFDEMRLDAVKHIDHAFLAKFLTEVYNGEQPFAVGESFDYGLGNLAGYHNLVTTSANSGNKAARLSLFDFPLRANLKDILNNAGGGADIYQLLDGNDGLVWGTALTGFDVVTWLDNHDTDRIGFAGGSGTPPACNPGEIPSGNSCLVLSTEGGHDPIFNDKEDMGYPFLMAAEGRPSVFWKDYFWFGMKDDIDWLMALRKQQAQGGSVPISGLNGFWPQGAPYDGDNNGGNTYAMRRDGLSSGSSDGLLLGLNDHPSKNGGLWVDGPFSNKILKDYSDGFLFVPQQAFANGRAFITTAPRDYSWWSLTGLYPSPPGETPAVFTMDALPGGSVHFVALRAADASSFLVNGAPIQPGDQLAVLNAGGQVCGIGRIGQGFAWDGVHDMLIEVIGPFPTDASPTGGAANGMAVGETLRLVVYDQSAGATFEAGSIAYAASGTGFTFSPLRPNSPNRNGNFSSFSLIATGGGGFAHNARSRVVSFQTIGTFPVEWLDLSARASGGQIELRWSAFENEATRHYEVEMRPAQGQDSDFAVVARREAQGRAASRSYQQEIAAPAPGAYFLRIRQLDRDGASSLSARVLVQVDDWRWSLSVAPSPLGSSPTLRSTGIAPQEVLRYSLLDPQGRKLFGGEGSLDALQQALLAWNAQAPAGIYLLRASLRGEMQTLRLLK